MVVKLQVCEEQAAQLREAEQQAQTFQEQLQQAARQAKDLQVGRERGTAAVTVVYRGTALMGHNVTAKNNSMLLYAARTMAKISSPIWLTQIVSPTRQSAQLQCRVEHISAHSRWQADTRRHRPSRDARIVVALLTECDPH
jgi:hypothetical protein